MKRKAYTITGTSFTKPDNLPDGFTVEETEAEDPRSVSVASICAGGVRLNVYRPRRENTVRFERQVGAGDTRHCVTVTQDSARQVRDCLNAILGEQQGEGRKSRVLAYAHDLKNDWRWFETSPGLFTYARSLDAAIRDSLKSNETCTNRTIAGIREDATPSAIVVEVIA
ncbi:hypothetical protein [Lentzea sp. NBRC 102530]|uniref:hypothetical protein n=1 Tax=Lentzea sp. NBRC 102530 TaxID=3032201 RepID=UPI0024A3AC14|nr:hypothetical protein [Lentzea sp. NBRC 102530]GLY55344.1 hypothetical protein Lesp01_89990 [Lentzea sp. NBRC 102530]